MITVRLLVHHKCAKHLSPLKMIVKTGRGLQVKESTQVRVLIKVYDQKPQNSHNVSLKKKIRFYDQNRVFMQKTE